MKPILQHSGILCLDLETTSSDEQAGGIIEIGAKWLHSGDEFFRECRPEEGCLVEDEALRVNGYDRHRIFEKKRMPEAQAVVELFGWMRGGVKVEEAIILLGGWKIAFDHRFIRAAAFRSNLEESNFPFRRSLIDAEGVLVADIIRGKFRLPPQSEYHWKTQDCPSPEYWGGLIKNSDNASEILGIPKEKKPHGGLNGARWVHSAFLALGLREEPELGGEEKEGDLS